MNLLEIKYQSNTKDFELEIFLGSDPVNYKKTDDSIIIETSIPHGFHLLKIKLSKYQVGDLVTLTSAKLDNIDFRHTFYATFTLVGKKQTTCLSSEHDCLCIPFMNPLVWWITTCLEKLPSKYFGGRLYDEMVIYYPESVQLTDHSATVKDYFLFNKDFTVHPKYSLEQAYYRHDVPYLVLGDLIQYNEQEIVNELFNNYDFLKSQIKEYYGQKDTDDTINQGTQFISLYDNIQSQKDSYDAENDFMLDKNKFPKTLEFFKQLPVRKVFHSMLGILEPGQVIRPHVDKYSGYEEFMGKYGGCSQIYVPLNFKPGNYFKMTNVGLVPTDQGAVLINNHDFTHSVINDSDECRFAILIVATRLLNA